MIKQLVEAKPIVFLRFDHGQWERLLDSRRGISEFTVARSHVLFEHLKVPTMCLINGKSHDVEDLFLGMISSRAAVTTLESRIKVRRVVKIKPRSEAKLLSLVTEKPHARNLKERLQGSSSVIVLSPKLSSHLIDRLASIEANCGVLRAVAESLSTPKRFRGIAAFQEDAVRSALMAFGLTPESQARSLELVAGRETALARVGIMEDSVIEHDARHIPGYEIVESDLTGRAVFESKNGSDRLEVFTANRLSLEHCFGVDLIYLNASRQNIVMLQYKMLESTKDEDEADWIYRPDAKLNGQIRQMRKFAIDNKPGPFEYRLNPAVFYLKFVKRDAAIRSGGIVIPIDHFERLRKDPACLGPKKGLRVSYKSLCGRYLRQGAFLDLVRSGYIGAHAETTGHMKALIQAVLNGNRAVVAAIQQSKDSALDEHDVFESDLIGEHDLM